MEQVEESVAAVSRAPEQERRLLRVGFHVWRGAAR